MSLLTLFQSSSGAPAELFGEITATFFGFSNSFTGAIELTGNTVAALPAVTTTFTGSPEIVANSTANLSAATGSIVGTTEITGAADSTFNLFTGNGQLDLGQLELAAQMVANFSGFVTNCYICKLPMYSCQWAMTPSYGRR